MTFHKITETHFIPEEVWHRYEFKQVNDIPLSEGGVLTFSNHVRGRNYSYAPTFRREPFVCDVQHKITGSVRYAYQIGLTSLSLQTSEGVSVHLRLEQELALLDLFNDNNSQVSVAGQVFPAGFFGVFNSDGVVRVSGSLKKVPEVLVDIVKAPYDRN